MPRLKPLWLLVVCLLTGSAQAQPCCRVTGEFYEMPALECTERWLQLGGSASTQTAWQALQKGLFIPYIDSIHLPHPAWERDSVFLSFCLINDTDEAIDLLLKFRDLKGAWLWEQDSLRTLPFLNFKPGFDANGYLTTPERLSFTYRLGPGQTARFLYRAYYPYWAGRLYPHIYKVRYYEKHKGLRLGYDTLFNGIVFGIGFIFALSVLLLYTQVRDMALIPYALYICIFLIYFWRDFEFLNLQFYTTLAHVRWIYTKSLFPAAISLTYIWFVRRLLDIPQRFPRLNRLMTIISGGILALVITDYWMLAYHQSFSYYIAPYGFSWLMWLLMLGVNYFFWASKEPVARFVALGSLFLILGGVTISLLPTHVHQWIIRLAFIIELCCFTVAIAYRAKITLQEKQTLQQTLWEENIKHRIELETQIAIEKTVEAERIRSRVAQDIHDEVGGNLTKILLSAQLASQHPDLSVGDLKERIVKMGNHAIQAAGQLREIVFATNPDFDRFSELQAYFREQAREFWEGTRTTIHFDFEKSPHDPIVPPDMKRELLLIFKEAQNNAAKHAAANNIWLTVKLLDSHTYLMEVRDDGRGMPNDKMSAHTQGQRGMRQRAERIGAELTVESAPGEGVRVGITGKM